jgi:hypothetical protein
MYAFEWNFYFLPCFVIFVLKFIRHWIENQWIFYTDIFCTVWQLTMAWLLYMQFNDEFGLRMYMTYLLVPLASNVLLFWHSTILLWPYYKPYIAHGASGFFSILDIFSSKPLNIARMPRWWCWLCLGIVSWRIFGSPLVLPSLLTFYTPVFRRPGRIMLWRCPSGVRPSHNSWSSL